ncbi:type 2 DNA topoisomerase 6 subunit B-like [Cryptomeria japonica]|uniref:type 2 DNA topoisomerase 6 subunit B-like n=1 Tax=Cryptomeria japonica TaxID=3369 RepID=UPI0027DA68D1|nr:type 2 DNA topoisomerase 6 subunit B-like [Cryptomeria japonica]
MDPSRGKSWKKQLQQQLPATVPSPSANKKAIRILPLGIKVRGNMGDNRKSKAHKISSKVQIQMAAKDEVTFETVTFKGLNGADWSQGKKIDKNQKPSANFKEMLLKLMCRSDLTQREHDNLKHASKGRGMKKTSLREGEWKCLLDVLKSRLIGASRASDIAIAQPLESLIQRTGSITVCIHTVLELIKISYCYGWNCQQQESPCSIALDLCLEPFDNSETCCENIFMWNEGILLPKSMSKIDRLAKGTVDYRINNMQKLDNQVQGPLAFRECFKVGRGSVYSLEANTKMEIVFEVVLVLEIAKDTNKSCSTESTIKAKALYFEEYFPNSVTVSMVQALKSVDWKNYGLHMKGIEVDNFGDASIEWEGLQTIVNLDIVLHRYKREYPPENMIDSVQVFRHLFFYKCLKRRKKAFSELVIVKNALGKALNELKENNPELFLSQRACKMKTYAPDLSRSISGLIMSSNDMNFKEECAHIVGVSLEDLCQEKLLSCINKKILDVINITDRNPTKRTANTDVQPTCEEPSKEECEDEVDNENNLDEYTSIWDFL